MYIRELLLKTTWLTSPLMHQPLSLNVCSMYCSSKLFRWWPETGASGMSAAQGQVTTPCSTYLASCFIGHTSPLEGHLHQTTLTKLRGGYDISRGLNAVLECVSPCLHCKP